jgi:hypothetical protein
MKLFNGRRMRRVRSVNVLASGLLVFFGSVLFQTPLMAQTFVSGSTGAEWL